MKQIVVVGASVRPAAQSARRAGYRVIGIDLFGDTDTLDACHRYFNLGRGQWQEMQAACRGIAAIQVGGLQMHHWKKLHHVLSLPQSGAHRQLRDLGRLRELASRSGLGFPPTIDHRGRQWDGAEVQWDNAEVMGGGRRWLQKQPGSCGGLGVRWYRRANPRAESMSRDQWIQAWIPGRAMGITFLSDGRRSSLLAASRSLFTRLGDRPFVYSGSLGPIALAGHHTKTLLRLGQAVAETGFRGIWNADCILDRSDRLWLLEINPRWSGSSELIERWLIDRGCIPAGQSLLQWVHQSLAGRLLCHGADPALQLDNRRPMGGPLYLKRIVYARKTQAFDLQRWTQSLGDRVSLCDVPRDGTVLQPGDPLCTVIRRIDEHEKDPLGLLRILLHRLSGQIATHSPRSSAYE